MDPSPYGTLQGRDAQEPFILVFLLVERFLRDRRAHCGPLRRSLNRLQPRLSDAEVLTIVVVGELKQMPSKRAWYHELKTAWADWFPGLNERSRPVRRRIARAGVLAAFRVKLIEWLGLDDDPDRLVDSTGIALAHFKRARFNLNTHGYKRPRRAPSAPRGHEQERGS